MYHDRTAWRCAFFCGRKVWKQRISTKKCCPYTVNIACHVRQSIIGCRSSRKGGQVSKTNIQPVGRWGSPRRKHSDSNQKNFTPQVSRDLWNGGQVFKFVWRLCWKINVVCMSLSPFDSFQSRFVTYLLNRPRIIHDQVLEVQPVGLSQCVHIQSTPLCIIYLISILFLS